MKNVWEYSSFEEYKEENKNIFNKHDIEYIELGGKNCILKFKELDTEIMAITFTYVDGVLTISGDLGYAVFTWNNPKNHILAHLNFKSIGYVMEKCVAYKDEDVNEFSSELAQKYLTEIFEEYELKDMDDIPYFESSFDRDCWCYDNADNLFDCAYETGIYKVGDYLGERPYLWWTAFHLALKKLEEGI